MRIQNIVQKNKYKWLSPASKYKTDIRDGEWGEKTGGAEICALLEYYAAYSGKSVLTYRDKLSVPKRR